MLRNEIRAKHRVGDDPVLIAEWHKREAARARTRRAIAKATRTPSQLAAHREKRNKAMRAYRQNNKDRMRRISVITRRKLKQEIIEGYGNACVCCGDKHFEFLTIDHIYGGGSSRRDKVHGASQELYRHLKREGFPRDEYRLLCMNCNFAVGKYGKCPHQTDKH